MDTPHNDYYTYAFLREDKTPYYIGKGRGNRINYKNRAIKPPKDKSRIIFLKKNLTEAEAFKHEIYMIFVLGRKDLGTGILRNLTNGGDGASGHIKSEECKKKISETNTGMFAGENNPMHGVPHTEESKKKMSEAHSGVPKTEEHKKKISVAKSGVPKTEETKKKMSEAKSGEKNPRFGVPGITGALNPLSKAIIAIKPDGTELHFGSVHEAARELGIDPGNLSIRYLKTGKVPKKGKFKGWQFLYENP
jgi:hypothetical protein